MNHMMQLTSLFVLLVFSSFNALFASADAITDQAQGAKLIYLDFWASWCAPCKASFPWMNQLHQDLSDQGVKIIAVNLDSRKERADAFLMQYPARFTVIFNPESDLARAYNVQGMPHSFILDAQGKVLYQHIGFKRHETDPLRKKIEYFLHHADTAATAAL